MTRILVLGYYGFGNFGDELILSAVQDELTSIECQAVFAVNKPDQYANPVCPRHTFVDRHSPTAMRAALGACDYVMLGGGGLIQDVTSWRSSLYYLGILLLAALHNERILSYAQGVGPVRRFWIRRVVRSVFDRMILIDVRDDASRDLLLDCGVRTRHLRVVRRWVYVSRRATRWTCRGHSSRAPDRRLCQRTVRVDTRGNSLVSRLPGVPVICPVGPGRALSISIPGIHTGGPGPPAHAVRTHHLASVTGAAGPLRFCPFDGCGPIPYGCGGSRRAVSPGSARVRPKGLPVGRLLWLRCLPARKLAAAGCPACSHRKHPARNRRVH